MTVWGTEQKKSQWGGMIAATVFIALGLLILGIIAEPAPQAIASEDSPPEISLYSETSEGEGPDNPGFEVYSLTGQDNAEAQTNQSNNQGSTIIPEFDIPLINSGQATPLSGNGGSYVNTGLIMLCILIMGVMLLLLLVRRTTDYRVIAVRTIAVTFGLVTVVVWSLFDWVQVPTVLINSTTTLLATLFVVFVIMTITSYAYESKLNKKSAKRRKKG
ncbi:MAG: hypothetical protein FWE96_02425 [Coriobacteriia bacterium]|nr:hypothetical protein [Coriobacteriia bacterium]